MIPRKRDSWNYFTFQWQRPHSLANHRELSSPKRRLHIHSTHAWQIGWQRYSDYLISKEKFRDFILSLDYKYPSKGDSGVFVRLGGPKSPVKTGIEHQILDSFGKPNENSVRGSSLESSSKRHRNYRSLALTVKER